MEKTTHFRRTCSTIRTKVYDDKVTPSQYKGSIVKIHQRYVHLCQRNWLILLRKAGPIMEVGHSTPVLTTILIASGDCVTLPPCNNMVTEWPWKTDLSL